MSSMPLCLDQWLGELYCPLWWFGFHSQHLFLVQCKKKEKKTIKSKCITNVPILRLSNMNMTFLLISLLKKTYFTTVSRPKHKNMLLTGHKKIYCPSSISFIQNIRNEMIFLSVFGQTLGSDSWSPNKGYKMKPSSIG